MKLISIPLTKLHDHPQNPNIMNSDLIKKLKSHIQQTGNYEPLIVRTHPELPDSYQLLNGHHRRKVLQQLNYTNAHCIVWNVNDDQALMLLATLNRLTGQDHPARRAQLIAQLTQTLDKQELLKKLPDQPHHLDKLLALNIPPKPAPPEKIANLPQALTFFVTKQQKTIIENALKQIAAQTPNQRQDRAQLLTTLATQIS